MTYLRVNGVEKVINDNGTMLFHQKPNQNKKKQNEFDDILKEKINVEIPVFPQKEKIIMLIEADGREHISDTLPAGAKFLYSSAQFNVYKMEVE